MKLLGKIARLQIQRSCLKRVVEGRKVYDPAPIQAVDELTLTRSGACARTADGGFVLDVHNTAHPTTRNNGPNPLSFVFTGHYAAIQERFGNRLAVGCAGENILVEAAGRIGLGEVTGGLVIATKSGRVTLGNVTVAAPCASFTAYALDTPGASPEEAKASLQFLDCGMRGFYCALTSDPPATIALGDEVFAV